MLDCVLITDDEALRRQVRSIVQGPESSDRLVLELSDSASRLPRERITDILSANPRVVFVDLGDSVMGLRVLEVLSKEAPEVTLIAAGPDLAADSLLRVIRAGASEYLPRPFAAEDLSQAFTRIRHRLGKTRAEDANTRGQVITLFSSKGGVGVTTISVNLAVVLKELTGKSTIVLDLAPMLGTVALSIGLQPRFSYLDVIQNFHRVDEELFRSFLEQHESGVHVLASPPGAEGQVPSMDEVLGLLRFCRRHYANVVVDAGHNLTDAVEVAFRDADHRLIVATPELPALRNVKRAMEILSTNGTDGKSAPRIILNQYADGLGVTVAEVEKGLGLSVDTVVDRDSSLISESINLGRPAVLLKKSSFERSLTDLGARITGNGQSDGQKVGLLKALLRPFRSNGSAAATTETN
jgi:pilus assembly protein CpaE